MTGQIEKAYKNVTHIPKKVVEEAKRPFASPKIKPIPDPDPSPTPLMGGEIQSAKARIKKRKRGRKSTILAGRMMAGRKQILKTKIGE